ncbi:putative histone-arginine methyltransferase CARM1 [Capsicum annuum]|nr:putative histone-arginine methyltransferase CARM1 [Capsicum annuum]
MEVTGKQKLKENEFVILSISEVSSASSSTSFSKDEPILARFGSGSGVSELRFDQTSDSSANIVFDLRNSQLLRLGPAESLCISEASKDNKERGYSRGISIQFKNDEDSRTFHCAFEQWKTEVVVQGSTLPNGAVSTSTSKFDEKIEASSAKMYFHYYGQLLHQQNMLQDFVRTGTYYAAVIENRADFLGRVVVDVGAGSGILSLFAAQAGAKHVYAVEASEMAEYAKKLIAGNPSLSERITVIKGKVEEVELPVKADILISEPMGTLLVNERMLESYVIARDRFLPVVDAFDPRLLIAPAISHVINFTSIKEEDLYEIEIPLKFTSPVSTRVHGLACWFDVLFNGSTVPRWLTTAPGAPTTHWYQLRCVLSQPLYVMPGQEITGHFRLVAHKAQSYTIYLTLSATVGDMLQTSSGKLDLKEPYYRMSQPQAYSLAQDQQPNQLLQTPDILTQPWVEDGSVPVQQPSPNHDAELHSL